MISTKKVNTIGVLWCGSTSFLACNLLSIVAHLAQSWKPCLGVIVPNIVLVIMVIWGSVIPFILSTLVIHTFVSHLHNLNTIFYYYHTFLTMLVWIQTISYIFSLERDLFCSTHNHQKKMFYVKSLISLANILYSQMTHENICINICVALNILLNMTEYFDK